MGRRVVALPFLEPDDILGVNTRQHLAQAHAIMQGRIQDRLMAEGVSIVDPRNTYIDGRARNGRDTAILPFSVIPGGVKVGERCRIGPFAHLRDGTVLDDGAEVGAFVEVNRSHLEAGTRARHLAYLGDAHLGRRGQHRRRGGHREFRRPGQAHERSATRPCRVGIDPGRPRPVGPGRRSAPGRWSPASTTFPQVRPSSACPPPGRSAGVSESAHSSPLGIPRVRVARLGLVCQIGSSSARRNGFDPLLGSASSP